MEKKRIGLDETEIISTNNSHDDEELMDSPDDRKSVVVKRSQGTRASFIHLNKQNSHRIINTKILKSTREKSTSKSLGNLYAQSFSSPSTNIVPPPPILVNKRVVQPRISPTSSGENVPTGESNYHQPLKNSSILVGKRMGGNNMFTLQKTIQHNHVRRKSRSARNTPTVKGPWTKAEDEILIEKVNIAGPKKWSAIAKYLPGRIGKQCRERWHNHLDPTIRRDPWTIEEEKVLEEAHRKYGNKWAKISKLLNGRPDNMIKNHWNSKIRRKKLREKKDRIRSEQITIVLPKKSSLRSGRGRKANKKKHSPPKSVSTPQTFVSRLIDEEEEEEELMNVLPVHPCFSNMSYPRINFKSPKGLMIEDDCSESIDYNSSSKMQRISYYVSGSGEEKGQQYSAKKVIVSPIFSPSKIMRARETKSVSSIGKKSLIPTTSILKKRKRVFLEEDYRRTSKRRKIDHIDEDISRIDRILFDTPEKNTIRRGGNIDYDNNDTPDNRHSEGSTLRNSLLSSRVRLTKQRSLSGNKHESLFSTSEDFVVSYMTNGVEKRSLFE